MKTMCSSAPTHNPSVKGTSCGKPQAAPYVERLGPWHPYVICKRPAANLLAPVRG